MKWVIRIHMLNERADNDLWLFHTHTHKKELHHHHVDDLVYWMIIYSAMVLQLL